MNKRGIFARTAVGALGGMMLIGVAGVAIADEIEGDDVDVTVNIEAIEPVGALTMSVAANSTALTEVDSGDEAIRQFNGTLPTVTVTDDREEVPEDVFWYVTGQSSSFTEAGGASFGAEHLGWVPKLLTEANGEVAEGPQVDTVLDEGPNNVGLVGDEFLALSLTSGEAQPVGEWEANADLFLKTPVDITPGSYSATLTLTLWEDAL
jgi:type 1 fimbria pilin